MKNRCTQFFNQKNSQGGVLVLVTVLLVVLIGVAALAIDVGYISTTRNELQNIADAGALAATGELGQIYKTSGTYTHPDDFNDIIFPAARDVGKANLADNKQIEIVESDVIVGAWDGVTKTFTPNTTYPNAVQVTARGDNILAVFSGIFGFDSFNLSLDAVAALTGQNILVEGEAKFPIAVSENWFLDTDGDGEPDGCDDEIHLSDTGTACAGWHSYLDSSNASELTDKIYGIIKDYTNEIDSGDPLYNALSFLDSDPGGRAWLEENYPEYSTINPDEGMAFLLVRHKDEPAFLNYIIGPNPNQLVDPFTTPEIVGGSDNLEFTGGVVADLFSDPLPDLFDFFKVRDDDGDDTIWSTTVPVYQDEDACINPSGPNLIVGAADIQVSAINPSPDNTVDMTIECTIKDLRGGGGTGGVLGTIPNLVE